MDPDSRGVAIVVPFLDHLGGTEHLASSLAHRFAHERIPVLMLTCVHRRERAAEHPAAGYGVEIVRMPVLQRAPLLDLTWTLPGSRLLAGRKDEIRGILAFHMPTAGVLASLAASRSGLPFAVLTQASGSTGDVTALNALPRPRWRVRRVNEASFVSAINGLVEHELKEAGIRPELIRRIPSACDTKEFRPPRDGARERARESFGVGPDELAIVFTGRLHPDKSLPTLFAAASTLSRELPLRLLLTGEGPERQRLEALAAELGIADRVRLLGRLPDQRPVLHAGDVFCLPSVSEGISVALLEAMASGLAVLVSRIPGNREVVTDGEDGLVVATGDEQAWTSALRRLAGDPALRTSLGRAARATVERRFRRDHIEGLYVEWFRGL